MTAPAPTALIPCFLALTSRGFTLKLWRHQEFIRRTFCDMSEMRQFAFGTLDGLLQYEAVTNDLRVVALYNNRRGNGDFVAAIAQLEEIARDTGTHLSIVQFENLRLAEWFGRRPGWTRAISKEHAEHAIYSP